MFYFHIYCIYKVLNVFYGLVFICYMIKYLGSVVELGDMVFFF